MKYIIFLTLALLVVTEVLGKHQTSKNEDDQGRVRTRRNHKIGHSYPTNAPITYPEVVPDEEYEVKAPPVEHHVAHVYQHGTDVVDKPYVSTHGVHHQVADTYSAAAGTNYEHLKPTSVTYPQVVQEASIPYEYETPDAASVVDNQEYTSGSVYEEPSKEIIQSNVPVTNYPAYNYPYYPTYYPQIPQYYSPYSQNSYVPQYQVPYYYPQGPIYYPPPQPQQGLVHPSGDNSQYSRAYNIPATQYGAYIPYTPYYNNEQQYTRDIPYYSVPSADEEEIELAE